MEEKGNERLPTAIKGGNALGTVETYQQCTHWHNTMKSWRELEAVIYWTRNVVKESHQKQRACPHSLDCVLCVCVTCRHVECLHCEQESKHSEESGHVIGYTVKRGGSWYPTLYCFQCKVHTVLLSVHLPGLERIIGKQPLRNAANISANASRLRGILNLSNTCYMNAILQVLVHTPLLHQFYVDYNQSLPQLQDSRLNMCDETQFLIGLGNVFREFMKRSEDPIIPVKLMAVIWEVMPNLAGNKQHDAHEFFISALHALHLGFLKFHTATSSLIDQIFLGRLRSTVRCKICGHSRLTVDPFWDISLEITPNTEGPIELQDLLKSFTKVESLEVECQIQCPTCGKRTESTKQLKFQDLPNVICIHLKRFRHSKSPSPRQCNKTTCTKIETNIKFDQLMDFSSFKTSEEEPSDCKKPRMENVTKHHDMYQLYAVVKHEGTHECGHYYTYINIDSNWYKGNDHLVTSVTRKEVLNTEAYLLFYKRFLLY
ncbi:Ubiquitin carboxyl-terminal hydrolase 22 [Orchesella cincta]|uniref:ubiquitinyl hydrolase 1 n=1 Tax=Orchesella cincta TaxID=48709 RepID=A0A1D2N2D9_ORCCI|nr:Ubiquitin carboxyl-terminal hydrolase 22 [Orchesella cincta]